MELLPTRPEARALYDAVQRFVRTRIEPAEAQFEAELREDRLRLPPVLEALKAEARAAGLWNLFLNDSPHGAGLTVREYAPMAELMGRVVWAPEVFNCSAPDTGNIEVLDRYGSEAQKARWLGPLLDGTIRSGFAMTEPEVASSDATNIAGTLRREGDHYRLNAHKWWTTGAGSPRCKVLIVLCKSDPAPHPERHRQHTMVVIPFDREGVSLARWLPVFGFDDAPHGHAELHFDNVQVMPDEVIVGEGRGFEIAQGRLGPGRIHHCMRLIGLAERALEKTCRRLEARVAFGKPIAEQSVWRERVADARVDIDQTRLLVLHAAEAIDTVGARHAKAEIAMIKIAAPNMACRVIDMAIQAHGAGGLSDDFGLSMAYAAARMLRIADGPDEVHRDQLARLEFARHR